MNPKNAVFQPIDVREEIESVRTTNFNMYQSHTIISKLIMVS